MRKLDIFFQKQVGGNCRLHALNGYFGCVKIDDNHWSNLMNEYDTMVNTRYNITTSCRNYDLICSGGQTIISWVLAKYGICTRYLPMGYVHNDINIITSVTKWVFMFNDGHIWGIRYYEPHKQWYKVDSIGGISSFDIQVLQTCKDGLIIPIPSRNEFVRLGSLLHNHIGTCDVSQYIKELLKRGDLLGDVEVWIGAAMECLNAQLYANKCCANECIDFTIMQKFVNSWYEFLSTWTNGNYANDELTLKYVPYFVSTVIKLANLQY